MAFGKVFDLHFEIGTNGPPNGDFYAKTILGGNAVIMEKSGPTPAIAMEKLTIDMEQNNIWAILAKNPNYSVYPFGGNANPVPRAVPRAVPLPDKTGVDPDAPKQMPGNLSQIPHPACTSLCTSFEHFGKVKCKSMCAQRRGV